MNDVIVLRRLTQQDLQKKSHFIIQNPHSPQSTIHTHTNIASAVGAFYDCSEYISF